MESTIPVLLVTANVGSIFEDPTEMLKIWTDEFLATIGRLEPKFLALHCQEVGGKNYEMSMSHVDHFVKLLMSSTELRLFNKIRVFLDEDYSSAENFTALGNLYFIHESLENIDIWDFSESKFVPVDGTEIHSGSIESVTTKEKAKFPQDFFPECKWSRKGFMRTRWSLQGTVVDFVNLHLFHDASNFIAMEAFPSVYCKNRRRALEHTLQRFHNDPYPKAPYFLFGDFNFRTDTDGVVKKLTDGMKSTRPLNSGSTDYSKLQFVDDDSKLVLTVGKKVFKLLNHQTVFLEKTAEWLKTFDKELEAFSETLCEYPVTFPPSYPFEENTTDARSYMQTRCPAWCDRVIFSKTVKKMVDEEKAVEYGLMGINTCMGDHKPVYLKVDVRTNAGTISCCAHTPFACLPDKCQCCRLFASIKINIIDYSSTENVHTSYPTIPIIDRKLLHEPITRDMLAHEPYTPESADSHSPVALEELDFDKIRKNSVSPIELKHKLQKMIIMERSKSPRLMQRSASETVDTIKQKHGFFRSRAMSEVPKSAKAKLIPTTRAASLQRLQSHHSSSDEEWFEFDNEHTPTKSLEECEECSEEGGSKADTSTVATTTASTNIVVKEDVPIEKIRKRSKKRRCRLRIRTRSKDECCCIA